MTDEAILDLYFERSETAISESRKQYGRLVRHIIARIIKSAEDTEECENDTYLSAWNAIPPNRPKSLKAYLAAIARNAALSRYEYLHADKRNPEVTVSFEELSEVLCNTPDGSGGHSNEELREIINDFLRTLNAEQRRVFLLRYWQCCSIQEIMGQCGYSKSKTESMLFRTRNRMRTFLEERGYMA